MARNSVTSRGNPYSCSHRRCRERARSRCGPNQRRFLRLASTEFGAIRCSFGGAPAGHTRSGGAWWLGRPGHMRPRGSQASRRRCPWPILRNCRRARLRAGAKPRGDGTPFGKAQSGRVHIVAPDLVPLFEAYESNLTEGGFTDWAGGHCHSNTLDWYGRDA